MKNKTNILMIIFTILILIGAFIVINFFDLKDNNTASSLNVENSSTTTTTSKVTEDDTLISDKIYVNGVEENIMVKKYISHLGFTFKYEPSLFSTKLYASGSILVYLIDDENNYIKIEKLNESSYYDEYNKYSLVENINDDYVETYKFLRRDNSLIYLKITKNIKNDEEYINNIGIRLDYIINSIYY